MSRMEIRITGYGGQGVVLSGYIIGKAKAINAGQLATMIQSFGPEARGSACSSTVVLSDKEILYPYIRRPDVFIVMSGDGYEKFKDELKDDGILVHEADLVHPEPKPRQKQYGVPSTRIAEQLGRSIIQNIVMLGFAAASAQFTSREEMRSAVKSSVPAGTEELNLKAFDAGWAYFEENYAAGKADQKGEAVAAPAV